jgi:branched-chain amino acid aminotransferase
LDGITRRTVMGLARDRGYEIIERYIPGEELKTFSEVFICGTAAEVTPVGEIGELSYTPGTITRTLMEDYAKLVRRQG